MASKTTAIKKGLCLLLNGEIYKVIEFIHVKPGKGSAFVRTKLKHIITGHILENTFPSGHKIENVRIENRNYKYLYRDKTLFYFMNVINYDQIFLDKKVINNYKFLKEGITVKIIFRTDNDIPLYVDMPNNVILKVIYTEKCIKGDTIINATKPAKLENGITVQVPLFIDIGEYIKINIEKCSYIERYKDIKKN
ncbi:MAG: elongation factor P [Candidatus Bostrichicola ureolyticus]|nr:MAG: elongation factor P [Candidatus Bostrichicola ureolyticus]